MPLYNEFFHFDGYDLDAEDVPQTIPTGLNVVLPPKPADVRCYGRLTDNFKPIEQFTAYFNNHLYANKIFQRRWFHIRENLKEENPHQDLAALRALFERKNLQTIWNTMQLRGEQENHFTRYLIDVGSCKRTYGYGIPGIYLIPYAGTGDYMRLARPTLVSTNTQLVLNNTLQQYYQCNLIGKGALLNFTDSLYYINDEDLAEAVRIMPMGLVGIATGHVFKREGAIYFGTDETAQVLGSVQKDGEEYIMSVEGNPIEYKHANRFATLEICNRTVIQSNEFNLIITVQDRIDLGATDYLRLHITKVPILDNSKQLLSQQHECALCFSTSSALHVRPLQHKTCRGFKCCQTCALALIKQQKKQLRCIICRENCTLDIATMLPPVRKAYVTFLQNESETARVVEQPIEQPPPQRLDVVSPIQDPNTNSYSKLFMNGHILDITLPNTTPHNDAIIYHHDGDQHCVVPLRKTGYAAIYRCSDIKWTDTITWQQIEHKVEERRFVIDTAAIQKAFRSTWNSDYKDKATFGDLVKILQTSAPKLPFECIPTVIFYVMTVQLKMKLEILTLKDSQLYQALVAVSDDKYTAYRKPFVKGLLTSFNNKRFRNTVSVKEMDDPTLAGDFTTLGSNIKRYVGIGTGQNAVTSNPQPHFASQQQHIDFAQDVSNSGKGLIKDLKRLGKAIIKLPKNTKKFAATVKRKTAKLIRTRFGCRQDPDFANGEPSDTDSDGDSGDDSGNNNGQPPTNKPTKTHTKPTNDKKSGSKPQGKNDKPDDDNNKGGKPSQQTETAETTTNTSLQTESAPLKSGTLIEKSRPINERKVGNDSKPNTNNDSPQKGSSGKDVTKQAPKKMKNYNSDSEHGIEMTQLPESKKIEFAVPVETDPTNVTTRSTNSEANLLNAVKENNNKNPVTKEKKLNIFQRFSMFFSSKLKSKSN